MDWISVAIEEYKTLRAESLESKKNQLSTLRMGTAAVGVVIASGFNLWEKTLLPDLLFLFFIPTTCYLVLMIWMGEVAGMMRAGIFLTNLEKKISAAFPSGRDVLTWENWLRTKDKNGKTPQMKMNYLAVIALFFLTALASIAIGNYKILGKISCGWFYVLNTVEGIFFLVAFIYIFLLGRRFR